MQVPIHLHKTVKQEINKLIYQDRSKKTEKLSDQQFINSIVIILEKRQLIKLALGSKQINKYVYNNKYQMPNTEFLLDNMTQVSKSVRKIEVFLSALDLRYTCLHILLERIAMD